MSYLRNLCLFAHCGVFLFCFASSCVPYAASFSGISIFDFPLVFSNNHLLFKYQIGPDTSFTRKFWRYQRGNQKPSMEGQTRKCSKLSILVFLGGIFHVNYFINITIIIYNFFVLTLATEYFHNSFIAIYKWIYPTPITHMVSVYLLDKFTYKIWHNSYHGNLDIKNYENPTHNAFNWLKYQLFVIS